VHNNYYLLRQLSPALEKIVIRSVVSECFSQNKDELIVRFETQSGSFYIKATVLPNFSCLSFPDNFQRARKNSIDLFEKLIGQRVTGIYQFKNERSFAIQLSNTLSLAFKMHGNHANIILFESGIPRELFRSNIKADYALTFPELDREIDWSYENFERNRHNLTPVYFTFGKVVWQYLDSLDFKSKTLQQKWELLQETKLQLESPLFYIVTLRHIPALSLLKTGTIEKTWTDPIAAINDFFHLYTQTHAAALLKKAVLSTLKAKIHSSKNYYKKNDEKLRELKQDNNYKVWADVIMANLHNIKPNADQVTAQNFYNNDLPVSIKLRKELSPQKNAEVYYRKAKNQQIELERIEKSLMAKETEILRLQEKLESIESTDDLKVIKRIQSELNKEQAPGKQIASLPYHEFIVEGFKILVGRNAENNDVLTFKMSYKEDLWLHAKDVSGSHVLIKYQAGKKFPKHVIERAAQLAAYNSKRKNETLCPVIVTPRKYVRKRKGDPAGAVVVEREEVLMVEPKLS
jgi:predicted ribosome quality control (RQC) complex YloA/Tae2 family protein